MNLPDYLNTLTAIQFRAFAEKCDIQPGYLAQLKCRTPGNENRRPSPKLSRLFVEHSGGALTLEELRPDIWGTQAA
jgi:hypothetical protein